MPVLEDAILLAVGAHRGQGNRGGHPYVLHPLRVMLRMDSEMERMVAALHDLIEDTSYTSEDLVRLGYPEVVVRAVECLTRRASETYEQFITRVKQDPLARRVKIADLEDNLDLGRMSRPSERDLERAEKYRLALVDLRGCSIP